MGEKDIIKLSRIHEEPTKEKLEEAISSLEKFTSYQKKFYMENQSDLNSIVSKIPDRDIKFMLYYLEKEENKPKEIHIGLGVKCSYEEYEKALKAEMEDRKKKNIKITDPLFEFEEYEMKTSPDSSEIKEIKKK